jgi:hypothetical protein
MEPEGSLPHSQKPSTLAGTEGSVRFGGLCMWFVTSLSFDGEELLAPRPTPKLEDHFVGCPRLLIRYIRSYPLCRSDRDPLFTAGLTLQPMNRMYFHVLSLTLHNV